MNNYKNDFEDTDFLGDESQVNFLDKKQRELVTSTVDYNLESLSQLINKKIIDLAPKYQRRERWDIKRKSKLIESFLMNVPIPPIFLNEDNSGRYSVIDGKQRLTSINDFLTGKLILTGLNVFKDINDKVFNDLPTDFQNSLKIRATIRAIIILRQSDSDIKYEVFQRLNTGGVSLNPQEIRNSAFPGRLNDKIIELSQGNIFHSMLGVKTKEKSRIYKEMKDVELVLRFFSLKDNWMKYAGGLKGILDTFMDKNKDMESKQVENYAKHFIETIQNVKIIFGENGSFRRWLPPNKKWKQQVSAPLYDVQMISCYKKNKNLLLANRAKIFAQFKKLFQDDYFLDSIQSSTANPKYFIYRIEKFNKIINDNN